ncbi:MAG: thiamine pyrophosphate-binding protein, partial [Gammaproteobacteria bacterium]
MLVPQAIARILKEEGVKYLFGYPLNPIIEAAAAEDIRTIIVRQERTGAHMADALSRMTCGEEIGVFVMQHGPGAENSFGGVAQAFGESVPVLFMPAGYDRKVANYFPNFNSTLNMKHITKWAEPITMGSEVPNIMRRAFTQLRNGRPGPVLVEIPWDTCQEEADISSYVPSYKTRSGPDAESVKAAAAELAAAEKPVIYAGQGINYAKAWDELKELAELLNCPVTTSLEGKSTFNETHPLSIGSGGHATPKAVYHFINEADLIFGIGCSFAITSFGTRMPDNKKVIHATLDPMDLNKDVPAQLGLIGDAKLTLRALIDELKELDLGKAEARRESTPADIKKVKDAWMAEWLPKL